MTDNKNLLLRNKATIVYSISLAFLLFLLKWLELRFIIFDRSFEIYIGFIAVIFTALGIWLALKLSKPKIETVVVEKEVYVNRNENFVLDTSLVSQLELSKRELEILSLLAQGHSNQEIAAKLFVSLSTVKTHIQNLFEKLEVKRRTQAIEKGLEPLAAQIFQQGNDDPAKEAAKYINEQVKDAKEALQGARDIIAEWISENQEARKHIRELFWKDGIIASSVIKSKTETEKAQKFKDYFDWSEPIRKTPSHRLLAMRRAENEGIISLDISPSEELALQVLGRQFIKSTRPAAEQVSLAIKDSYKRLLKPSMETEVRLESKGQADAEAREGGSVGNA